MYKKNKNHSEKHGNAHFNTTVRQHFRFCTIIVGDDLLLFGNIALLLRVAVTAISLLIVSDDDDQAEFAVRSHFCLMILTRSMQGRYVARRNVSEENKEQARNEI